MQTVLLGLNEINFDYVKHYASKGLLPNLKKLIQENDLLVTKSEDQYELQEPWIQWVTTYSGLKYSEHQFSDLVILSIDKMSLSCSKKSSLSDFLWQRSVHLMPTTG